MEPIIQASMDCDIHMFRYLILNGYDSQATDCLGRTPLMIVISSNHPDRHTFVRMLIAESANLSTAIGYATGVGQVDVMELLINAGANVNERNERGYTVLMRAVINCNYEGVKLLLSKGADWKIQMNHRERVTAFNLTRVYANKPIRDLLLSHMVLTGIRNIRYLKFNVLRKWTTSDYLGSPTSNSMFYNMGLALKIPKTLQDMRLDIPTTTPQNIMFYMRGCDI
jgi:ankyrin repeat protein